MAFYVTPLAPIRATPVSYIEDRIAHDARDGWPVEPGRYRLIAARACPWANRAVIVRRLLGLEDAISLGMPGQTHDARSWTFDLETEWSDYVRDGAPELYPEASRAEIDDVNDKVFLDVNNGPYRASFAGSQRAYEDAYRRLFARLDWLSDRLERQLYLVGETITEADIHLFTTLARFDAFYHG